VLSTTGGNSNYTYTWSTGNSSQIEEVAPSTSTMYYLTLEDNCSSPTITDSVLVTVNPNPYVQTITQIDSCEPLGMLFYPYPEDVNTHYHWNFGDPVSGNNESTEMYPSHVFQNAGTYSIGLNLTSDKGCTYDTLFENWIVVHALPIADFGMNPNPASLFNNTVAFTDLTESADPIKWIYWDTGNGDNPGPYNYLHSTPKSTYDGPGYYDVRLFAETKFGCKDTVTRVLRVNDEYTVYVPDAFSPGMDGRNDYFYPIGHGIDGSQEYKLTIYDRWGVEIFSTNKMPLGTEFKYEDFDPKSVPEDQRGWNGRYENTGKYVQNDVYSWALKIVDVNGVSHELFGKITVVR